MPQQQKKKRQQQQQQPQVVGMLQGKSMKAVWEWVSISLPGTTVWQACCRLLGLKLRFAVVLKRIKAGPFAAVTKGLDWINGRWTEPVTTESAADLHQIPSFSQRRP
jgi:hypothetical protein